ncbi:MULTISPECIES: glycosyltransferase family 25 protein [unclassified Marinobacter]|jgi:glycosyl transferase family 25|uniref:glycosyltransferase family 25 protein n=1 Tax=unclassified Marinobacter TaxID=83889 RepID=UPI0018F24444|nr:MULTISPECIES: glycosyltransferase family 25 protein [unclassified Marinobacter]
MKTQIKDIRIYKITENELSQTESNCGVTRVSPIMGAQLDAKTYFNYVTKRYNKYGKLSSPSEVGCTLTHISIYELILAQNMSAIILESDIVPTADELKMSLQKCNNATVDFIHLGWHPFVHHGVFFKGKYSKNLKLFRINPYSDFHGTFAYFITPNAAKYLLTLHKEDFLPADSWANFFFNFPITPYFFPIFTHPKHRGQIQSERISLSSKVYSLQLSNVVFYAIKNIKRSAYTLLGYKSIKPNKWK